MFIEIILKIVKNVKNFCSFFFLFFRPPLIKQLIFVGWLVTMRRVETKNKTMMKFITLEDHQGLVEAVLFDKAYKKYGHLFKGYGPYVVKGRMQSRLPGEANLLVEEVQVLQMEKEKVEKKLLTVEP